LRVHPDLFAHFPKAKDANGKSFQRLTEFLSTMKAGEATKTSSQTFPMMFFMRPVGDDSKAAETEEDLEQVNITLKAGGTILDKQKQLRHLFTACGLGADFALDSEGRGLGRNSIQGFMFQVSEQAVQKKHEYRQAMRDVWVRHHMLNLKHNIKATIRDSHDIKERCTILDKLLHQEVLNSVEKMGRSGEGRKSFF
jgi:hypothetical protein